MNLKASDIILGCKICFEKTKTLLKDGEGKGFLNTQPKVCRVSRLQGRATNKGLYWRPKNICATQLQKGLFSPSIYHRHLRLFENLYDQNNGTVEKLSPEKPLYSLMATSANSSLPVDNSTTMDIDFNPVGPRLHHRPVAQSQGLIKCESCYKAFTKRGEYKNVSSYYSKHALS